MMTRMIEDTRAELSRKVSFEQFYYEYLFAVQDNFIASEQLIDRQIKHIQSLIDIVDDTMKKVGD